jgi:hypothetical protein
VKAGNYLVWCPKLDESEDRVRPISASDAEEAAELWARDYDSSSAEYDIVSGRDEPVVHVRAPDGTLTTWSLTGESEPVYIARAVLA